MVETFENRHKKDYFELVVWFKLIFYLLLCRFITPDNNEYIDKENVKSFNLYAYCYNDPINYSDPEGNIGIGLSIFLSVIIGAVTSTVVDLTTQLCSNGGDWSNLNYGSLASSFILGGALGAAGGIGGATLGEVLLGSRALSASIIGRYSLSVGIFLQEVL